MTTTRNTIGTMLMLAAISPLGAHAASPAQQGAVHPVVIGKHGQTHADETLQNSVLGVAHNAVPILVRRLTKDPQSIACGRMVRTDTMVTKLVPSGAWTEVWTWTVCSTVLTVPINFVPSPKGGTDFTLDVPHATVRPANANGT